MRLFVNEKELKDMEDKIRKEVTNLEKIIEDKTEIINDLTEENNRLHKELADKNELIERTNAKIRESNKLLLKNMEHVNSNIANLASISEEHSATMEELTTTVNSIMERVNMAYDGAINNSGVMTKFNDDFVEIYEDADELTVKMQDISKIVDTIEAISNQTNLLSLNASIESARAGEAGRGFAIVASEIRKLAEQTKSSSVEIKKNIDGLQNKVLSVKGKISDGKINSEKLTESNVFRIENITIIKDGFSDIYASFEQITSASQEQSANIVETANEIDDITKNIQDVK
jgi:methyl-accepting chemotaxis protein